MQRKVRPRRGASPLAALLAAVGLLVGAPTSARDLSSRERSLQRSISSDSSQIAESRGRLRDLQTRSVLEGNCGGAPARVGASSSELQCEHDRDQRQHEWSWGACGGGVASAPDGLSDREATRWRAAVATGPRERGWAATAASGLFELQAQSSVNTSTEAVFDERVD